MRHQVLADAKVLQRALGLGSPELVGGHLDLSEAIGLCSYFRHPVFSTLPKFMRACPNLSFYESNNARDAAKGLQLTLI
jgi:hypothetical protein